MNKANIKFSVLMANYNNGKYIKEAIQSVIRQTYENWELIIVDDASSDDSIEKIKLYLKDERIRLLIHEKNLGCGGAKRTCAANASGEICGILDPDDVLREDAIEIMVKAYKDNPDCGFIYSTHYECNSDLVVEKIAGWVGELEKGKTNLHTHRTSAFRTFKKSVYEKTEGIDPEQRKAVDKDMIFKLEEVAKLKFINQPLYYYRKHEKGISSLGKKIYEAKIYDILAKYKAYKRRLRSGFPNLTAKEISDELYDGFVQSVKIKDFSKAKYFLLEAVKAHPFNFKAWFRVVFRILKFMPKTIIIKLKKFYYET